MKHKSAHESHEELQFKSYLNNLKHYFVGAAILRVSVASATAYLIGHFLNLSTGIYTVVCALLIVSSLYILTNYNKLMLLRYSTLSEYLLSEVHKNHPMIINDFLKSEGLTEEASQFTESLLLPPSESDLSFYKNLSDSDPLKLLQGLSLYGQANQLFEKYFYYGDLRYKPRNLKSIINMAQKFSLYKSEYQDPQILYDEDTNNKLRLLDLPVPTITPTGNLLNDDQNYYIRMLCILLKNSFISEVSPYYSVVKFINSYNTLYLSLKTYDDTINNLNSMKRDQGQISDDLREELDKVLNDSMKIRIKSLYDYLMKNGAMKYSADYGEESQEIVEDINNSLVYHINKIVRIESNEFRKQ